MNLRIRGDLQLLETEYFITSWGKIDMVIVVRLDLLCLVILCIQNHHHPRILLIC
ncbi:hypothetical protein LINPERPRIM_LOCUS27296 [Linum perenne]